MATFRGPAAEWERSEFEVDGVAFRLGYETDSEPDRFIIRKPAPLVRQTIELLERLQPRRIVELGLAAGGSFALLEVVARPERLVGIEYSTEPISALTDFLAVDDRNRRCRPYYGIDQGDGDRLAAIVAREFGASSLDLVIDDASHEYERTRDTFDLLFPHLRPGGRYVIEDWSHDLKSHVGYDRALARLDRSERDQLIEQAARSDSGAFAASVFQTLITGRPERAHREIRSRIKDWADGSDPVGLEELRHQVRGADAHLNDEEVARLHRVLDELGLPPENEPGRSARQGAAATDRGSDHQPLARLTTELAIAAGTGAGLIASLTIDEFWTEVERGPDPVEDGFSITELARPFGLLVP